MVTYGNAAATSVATGTVNIGASYADGNTESRAVNAAGVHSDYSATTTAELFGLTTPPSTPQTTPIQTGSTQL